MFALKAQVKDGRLRLDEPTDLPEGKVVEIVALDDDGLTDEDRERLLQMIDESLAEDGPGTDLSTVIERLRTGT